MAFQKKSQPDPTPETLTNATLPPVPGGFKPDFTKRTQAPVQSPQKAKLPAKILHRPAAASQTEVPQELSEYYSSLGCQVHFVWADSRLLAQESTYGRLPVQVEDLPPEVVKAIRPWFEDPAKHGGQLRRSDAVVVYQPIEARDAWRLDAIQQEQMREDAFLHQAEQIGEIVRTRTQGTGLRSEVTGKVSPLADHIIGGPELMKMLEEDEGTDAAGAG